MNLDGVSELFLTNVGKIQSRIDEASRQVSSGKSIATASDAPDRVEPLLQLRAESARNTQIKSNLSLAQIELAPADQALSQAIKLMDRARVLGAQGATGTMDQSQRDSLADGVQSIQEQMVAVSRTAVQGNFLFSGDRPESPAYELDLTAPSGVAELEAATADASREIEDPAGGAFACSLTARNIFDARTPDGSTAAGNVFAALNELRLALTEGDSEAITDSLNSVQEASQHLGRSQSFYATVSNRIDQAESYSASLDVRLKTSISEIEDADVAAAAVELTQANTQLKAAFEMRANLPTRSLFDYLG